MRTLQCRSKVLVINGTRLSLTCGLTNQAHRPRADGAHSLNHLVRARQNRRRDRDSERLSGLEIDDQFDLRGLLDWQVARFRAPENLGYITSRSPKPISEVRPEGHQPS